MFGSRLGAQGSACSYTNAEMTPHNHVTVNLTRLMQGFGNWLCLYQHIFNSAHQPLLLQQRLKRQGRKKKNHLKIQSTLPLEKEMYFMLFVSVIESTSSIK